MWHGPRALWGEASPVSSKCNTQDNPFLTDPHNGQMTDWSCGEQKRLCSK